MVELADGRLITLDYAEFRRELSKTLAPIGESAAASGLPRN